MKLKKVGQSTIEYILIFVGVVVIVILALSPQGFVTKSINASLGESIKGLELMTGNVYYNVYNE